MKRYPVKQSVMHEKKIEQSFQEENFLLTNNFLSLSRSAVS